MQAEEGRRAGRHRAACRIALHNLLLAALLQHVGQFMCQ
jgi:hypothetical protein